MIYRIPILALWCAAGCAALVADTPEYEIKAAYLYNFSKFIEWPNTGALNSVTICIYGKDPFGGFLDDAVRGKLVHGLPLAIRRLPAGEESWDQCQVLFLGISNSTRLEAILRRLEGRSIVTIGESGSFAEAGGMIGLVVDHGRVRFDVNVAAITAARLQISSRMVELGRVVRSTR